MAQELLGALGMSALLLQNTWRLQVGWEGTVLGWEVGPCVMHKGERAPNTSRPKSTVTKAGTLLVEQSAEV